MKRFRFFIFLTLSVMLFSIFSVLAFASSEIGIDGFPRFLGNVAEYDAETGILDLVVPDAISESSTIPKEALHFLSDIKNSRVNYLAFITNTNNFYVNEIVISFIDVDPLLKSGRTFDWPWGGIWFFKF